MATILAGKEIKAPRTLFNHNFPWAFQRNESPYVSDKQAVANLPDCGENGSTHATLVRPHLMLEVRGHALPSSKMCAKIFLWKCSSPTRQQTNVKKKRDSSQHNLTSTTCRETQQNIMFTYSSFIYPLPNFHLPNFWIWGIFFLEILTTAK